MMSLDQAIAQYEQFANVCEHHGLTASQEEFEQLAAWLRELQERRKVPEIVYCKDCKASYRDFCLRTLKPVKKEKDYCSWSERRTDG